MTIIGRYQMLSNAPNGEGATISVLDDTPEWLEAFRRWSDGEDPTDSPEWEKGVHLTLFDSTGKPLKNWDTSNPHRKQEIQHA